MDRESKEPPKEKGLNHGTHLIVAAAAVLAVTLFLLPQGQAACVTAEGGLIENLSVAILACGVIGAVLKLWRSPSWLWASISLLLLWMYMRELDYQRQFTPRSIESTGFYLSGKVPLNLKLAAAAALTPFVLGGFYLLVAGVRAIRRAPERIMAWRWPVGCAALFASIALIAEKWLPPRYQVLEETAELGLASLIVFIVARNLGCRNTEP